jgi:hypothetical protein
LATLLTPWALSAALGFQRDSYGLVARLSGRNFPLDVLTYGSFTL